MFAFTVGFSSEPSSASTGMRKTFHTAEPSITGHCCGVGVTDWMVGLDFSFFTDNDANNYTAGPGFQAAAVGLGIAVLGLLILLAGRWDARTRGSLKREARARAAARAAEPAS